MAPVRFSISGPVRSGIRIALLVGSCLIFSLACKPKTIGVSLSESADLTSPVFKVAGDQDGNRSSWVGIRVFELAGPCQGAECRILWDILAVQPSKEPLNLPYGESPSGFITRVDAEPLEPGGRYRLVVEGGSGLFGLLATGDLTFRVGPEGRLLEDT